MYGSAGGVTGSWPKSLMAAEVDSGYVQRVFEVGDTFNDSMVRMDVEGD